MIMHLSAVSLHLYLSKCRAVIRHWQTVLYCPVHLAPGIQGKSEVPISTLQLQEINETSNTARRRYEGNNAQCNQ